MSEFLRDNVGKKIDDRIRAELRKISEDCVKLWEYILLWYDEGGVENVERQLLALVNEILMEEEEEVGEG